MTRSAGDPSILAVDDEPQILEALSTILEPRGYRLRTAPNGRMALDAITAERPDVVLLDLAMAGMNGVEVCRRLRSFSRVPILVLSALTDPPGPPSQSWPLRPCRTAGPTGRRPSAESDRMGCWT